MREGGMFSNAALGEYESTQLKCSGAPCQPIPPNPQSSADTFSIRAFGWQTDCYTNDRPETAALNSLLLICLKAPPHDENHRD
jgi:hypothetical protein